MTQLKNCSFGVNLYYNQQSLIPFIMDSKCYLVVIKSSGNIDHIMQSS